MKRIRFTEEQIIAVPCEQEAGAKTADLARQHGVSAAVSLPNRFDSEWGRKFEKFVEENGRVKEGVSSCYAIRNSVAHGEGQSLGPDALTQFYEVSLSLVAELEAIIR